MPQKLEAHSITSLAHRLKLLVSRATLREWIKTGKLKPEAIQAKSSRYLIFTAHKLDKVLALLEEGFEERIGRLAKDDAEAVRFRTQAQELALRRIHQNQRRSVGQEKTRESSPALNDGDARGMQHLKVERKNQKLFTGYGLYR